jgi:hypothetical protein
LKRIALNLCIVLTACAPAAAFADCSGSPAFQNCTDNSRDSYTVQRFGNTTPVTGDVAPIGGFGNQTQASKTNGGTTFISGRAADGASWNETITDYGNGTRTISGIDGQGIVYNRYCTSYGCN